MPAKPEYYHQLSTTVAVLEEQVKKLEANGDSLGKNTDLLKSAIEETRREIAVIKEKLEAQNKTIEKWETRMWGLIVILVGALLSLAAGLIVTLTKR